LKSRMELTGIKTSSLVYKNWESPLNVSKLLFSLLRD
jgi:hypothetical protein